MLPFAFINLFTCWILNDVSAIIKNMKLKFAKKRGELMRGLEHDVLLKTAGLLTILLLLCAVNIHFFVYRQRNAYSNFVHIFSVSGLLGTFCFLMDTVILDLYFEYYFRMAGSIFFVLGGLFAVFLLFEYFFVRKKTPKNFCLAPDLKSIFTAIDDIALIIDYSGYITEVNHTQKYEDLFGNSKTIGDIVRNLSNKTSESYLELLMKGMENKEKVQAEFQDGKTEERYLITYMPVLKREHGFIIVITNISDIKKSEIKIKMYNKYLKEANHKLTDYIKIANTLEAEKERLSLLEQIQKDLIHRIENAIILIKNIQRKLAKNPEEYQHTYQDEILQVTDILRKVYKDVRRTITQIQRTGKVIK